ncbi:ABC transporter substrate-binding protein [Oceanisphaera sediminis]|uniref:ABC transporter substrate-binding protein n=1 Tax=Oceanisphaera sediminis TaxID=981381 RepID=A0ABP7EQS6_9GAMM
MRQSVLNVALLGMALSAAGSAVAKDWKEIKFSVEGTYPPFSYTTTDGELKGFEVDLARALCEELQITCTIRAQDWDGIIPALLSRKNDAIIAAMTITPEREKSVLFTIPYARVPTRFVTKAEREIEFNNEGMDGLKVGVQRATIGDKYLAAQHPEVDVARYGTFDEAFMDLRSGRIDTVFGGAIGLQSGLLDMPDGKDFHFSGPSFTEEKWFGRGIGIAVRKQDASLAELLNKGILALREKGIHQQIAGNYFPYDIYGVE